MKYPLFSIIWLIFMLGLGACSRLGNRVDPIAVQCGEGSENTFKAVLDASGERLSGADLEAFLLYDEKRQSLSISDKGCVGFGLTE